MKKIFALLLLSSAAIQVMAQNDKEPYMTKSLDKETIRQVEASTSGGYINVYGVAASEARVEVYITGNNSNNSISKEEIAQRLADKYELTVGVNGDKLTVIAKPKERIKDWKKALSISFKVYVPETVSTELRTSGGSISLLKLSGGKQDFATSGGSLHVNQVSGDVKGRTSGGSIHVENSKQDLDLVTSGGSIHAKACEGKLRLSTSGGSIYLDELKGDIKATTSGGSIEGSYISGELAAHTSGGSIELKNLACSLESSTSGGHIRIAVASLGKYIRIRNSGGSVALDLPKGKGLDLDISGKIKTDRLEDFSGSIDENSIDGKMNGGGVEVQVRAGSGRVSLGFR